MISKKLKYVLVFMIGALFLAPTLLQAKGDKKDGKTNLQKTAAQRANTFLDINNISTWFYNNGNSDITPNGNSGFVYPIGSGKTAVFASGLLWGAKVDGDPDPRVGGSAYRTGMVPGNVDANGIPGDGDADLFSIYRVRRDVYPGGPLVNLARAAVNEGTSEAALRAEYEQNWTQWPATLGAPYDDINNDGVYDPNVDIPGFPGADQTIWYVTNDLDPGQSTFLYGANPLGLEIQTTIWAYNKAGALGNMYFRKYKFINVTNRGSLTPTTFKDMYVSMWSDVDLGDAGDDFVGVDTTLSLQYCYNATASDNVYAPLPPPAVGFDFFQGPKVAGVAGQDRNRNGEDDATEWLKTSPSDSVQGFIYLPMTAAYYFANADATIGDPGQGTIQGSREFYNFFQGKFGVSGATFTDLATGQPTTYALNGDPVAGTGWLDGVQLAAGDRRQGSASGPFDMAPGDVQEVVVAEIVAGATPGSDNLKAITTLRQLDVIAQRAYDDFFQLPDAPPAPVVNAVALDQKIVLDWGSSLADVALTETNVNKNFNFQGYNLYQFPTASSQKEDGIKIGTWDIVDGVTTIFDLVPDPASGIIVSLPQQLGSDIGLIRSFTFDKDFIKQRPLVNGIKYYYAVTAYSYSPDPTDIPNNLENPISSTIFTVIPQSPDPGVTYAYGAGDTLKTIHTAGISDGSSFALVIDPTKINGHSYDVTFNADGSWNLVDKTTGTTKLANKTNLSGDGDYDFVDGLQVKVLGPPLLGKSFSYASASPPNLSPVATAADSTYTGGRWFTGGNHGGEVFFGGIFMEPNFWGGTTVTPDEYTIVEIRFRPMASFTDLNANSSYDIGEPYAVDDPTKTQKAFMYAGFSGGSYLGFFSLPFTAWDVNDPANPRQLNVALRDRDQNHQWDLHNQASPPDPSLPLNGDQRFNYTFILTTSYDATGTMYGDGSGGTINLWGGPGGDQIDVQWTMWVNDRGTGGMLAEEAAFTLIPNFVNTQADVFNFTAKSNTNSTAKAIEDVKSINVFPNPYYGVNTEELNKYQKFVTFNHLPTNAKIRIFNLAGIMVRTIDKVGGSQFERWDLQNENGLPVASGIYIAYIDMPDLGTTKILKLAVIQEEQILDRF